MCCVLGSGQVEGSDKQLLLNSFPVFIFLVLFLPIVLTPPLLQPSISVPTQKAKKCLSQLSQVVLVQTHLQQQSQPELQPAGGSSGETGGLRADCSRQLQPGGEAGRAPSRCVFSCLNHLLSSHKGMLVARHHLSLSWQLCLN